MISPKYRILDNIKVADGMPFILSFDHSIDKMVLLIVVSSTLVVK